MIEVRELTKRYGGTVAVNRISFDVGSGRVAGFLGPNGAGKTTTMRMLACFVPPTSGEARVAGYDVVRESLEVRRRIGYMPENVPLYGEMRVREYLTYRAKLKDVPRSNRRARIEEVMGRCGIREMEMRLVGQLSKGYRQRLGLADCLVHAPSVVILDEPTVGLDPSQIQEARRMIRGLREGHTVFLSTHLLHEAEMLCDDVILINAGRVVADGSVEDLLRGGEKVLVSVRGGERVREAIAGLKGVEGVQQRREGKEDVFEVRGGGPSLREAVAHAVAESGGVVTGLREERRTLEDVFAETVKRPGKA